MATQTGELGVTFPDNTLQTTAAIAGAPGFGGFTNVVVFTSTGTWTVPANVTRAKVTVVGGGGSGGGGGSHCVGGGGGGGGTAIRVASPLTPGQVINVTIGAGGVWTFPFPGDGGTSSFGAYCSATGGIGGPGVGLGSDILGAPGGAGGIGVTGTVNLKGNGGTAGVGQNSNYVIGGAGGGSSLGGGAPAVVASAYGSGAESPGLVGANGGGGSGAAGASAPSPYVSGGTGGAGVVIVEY